MKEYTVRVLDTVFADINDIADFIVKVSTPEHAANIASLGETDRFKAFTVTDTIEWENGHIGIAPEYIYDHGISNTLNP